MNWEKIKKAVPHFDRDPEKLVHPGRQLYRDRFWRGRDLTPEEDVLAHDYWSKYVQEPFDPFEGY